MDKINIYLTETTEHFFVKYSYVALYKTASAATSLERVSNELAVTWLHYACMIWKCNVPAANIALIWDTDSTGVNLFATPHLSRVRTYICIYMSSVYMCVCDEWHVLTKQSLERFRGNWEDVNSIHRWSLFLTTRVVMDDDRYGIFVMAYFCTNRLNRVQHSRYQSACTSHFVYNTRAIIRGTAIENDAHTDRGDTSVTFRGEGRSATDSMRVALPRSHRLDSLWSARRTRSRPARNCAR